MEQSKAADELRSELMYFVYRRGSKRDRKKKTLTQSYSRQLIVESHDLPCLEWTVLIQVDVYSEQILFF